jgi:hypothetical protein
VLVFLTYLFKSIIEPKIRYYSPKKLLLRTSIV